MFQDEVEDFVLEVSEVNYDFMGINSFMMIFVCYIDVNCGLVDGYFEIEDFRDQI